MGIAKMSKWILGCICGCVFLIMACQTSSAMEAMDEMDNKAAIYSLRKLEADYNGPLIQVRRSGDNALLAINMTEDGQLDTEQLLMFLQNDSGYIKTWYDQSGNSRHAVQSAMAQQPLIVSEGKLHNVDARPAIYFDETMELSLNTLTVPAPLSINMVGRTTYGNGSRYIFDPNGAEVYRWNVSPASNELRVGSDGLLTANGELDFRESFVSTAIVNGGSSSISLNGAIASGNLGTKGLTATATIGSNAVGVGLVGYMQELIIFSDAISNTERVAIEQNQQQAYLVPQQVRDFEVSAANNTAALSWKAPFSSYEAITQYRVEYKQASSNTWVLHSTTSLRKANITGLLANEQYDFRVRAENLYGTGEPSNVLTRRLGSQWGKITDSKAASNIIASTLLFPGVPKADYLSTYTALPLSTEQGFSETDIRLQLQRMKDIGINTVQISYFGADTLDGSQYLPMNAWINRTDGNIFEYYDRLIALIEEEGLYFYPLIETSSAMAFYLDFGVNNQKIVDRISYWAEHWGDSPNWLKLYNKTGEAKQVVSIIEAIKFKPYSTNLFEMNMAHIADEIADSFDIQIGFALDPTRLPVETEGGLPIGSFGPTPSELANSEYLLVAHPWEITVDGSNDEERTRWATKFLKQWTDAGIPIVTVNIAGYDASKVFPASSVYGKTEKWLGLQHTLAVHTLGTAGITLGPWNGWTEWYHITLAQGTNGDRNLNWAQESIRINTKHASSRPGYVENVAGTSAASALHLAWQPPVSDGGHAVTDYVIRYKPASSTTWQIWNDGISTSISTTISGLTANTLYDVQITAVNANGESYGSTTISLKTKIS